MNRYTHLLVFKKKNPSYLLLKPVWRMNVQKCNRAARKMNLFTTLAELWNYDSHNLFSKKDSFFEQLYGPPCFIAALGTQSFSPNIEDFGNLLRVCDHAAEFQ